MESIRPLFYLLGFLFLLNACRESDPCNMIDCGNGSCIDGDCKCDPGYLMDANGKCTLGACDTIDCVHGTCMDEICTCDPGYELNANGRCTVVSRDKFLGSYTTTETCIISQPSTYQTTIVAKPEIDKVGINNFWDGFFAPVLATVHGDTLVILHQEPDGDKFFVEGIGIYAINGDGTPIITFTYKVSDESSLPFLSETCTNTVYVKQ